MLDFLLVFSLPKLLLDDEFCGQALRLARDVRVVEDLPTRLLVDEVLANQHLIMADHTTAHWPDELYLPSRMYDRDNRENWTKAGAMDADRRAHAEVDRRLAAYEPPETDPLVIEELARIIKSGLIEQTELPLVPPPMTDRGVPAGVAGAGAGDGDAPRARRANPRRGR
jgi:trimethylamine--corrinoid protein Co-methyltransferase